MKEFEKDKRMIGFVMELQILNYRLSLFESQDQMLITPEDEQVKKDCEERIGEIYEEALKIHNSHQLTT